MYLQAIYKTDEDLIIRNMKIYPSIANRIRRLTASSDYQQQQIVNTLLNEILDQYGY